MGNTVSIKINFLASDSAELFEFDPSDAKQMYDGDNNSFINIPK